MYTSWSASSCIRIYPADHSSAETNNGTLRCRTSVFTHYELYTLFPHTFVPLATLLLSAVSTKQC